MNSVHREKSFVFHGDSKAIEEKLEAVGDLKTQIRGLINDNEDVKLNQEELNSNMSSVTQQLAMVAEALDRLSSNNGGGRTEIFRRVSRASGHSFRKQLSGFKQHPNGGVPQTAPITSPGLNKGLLTASPSMSANVTPNAPRKVSLEKFVKQLTDLAVTISTDEKQVKYHEPPLIENISGTIPKGNNIN